MLDIKYIRENPEAVKKNMEKRFMKPTIVDELLKADEQWRKIKKEIDDLRAKRNKLSEQINQLKKEKKDIKKVLEEARKIPDQIKKDEDEAEKLQSSIKAYLYSIPNIMHDSVPIGKDETQNKVIKTWGKPLKPDFELKPHGELMEELGIGDFETSAKISGMGFYYLKGSLALMNQALIRFAIDFMLKKDFMYVEPPLMVRRKVVDGMVDLQFFNEIIYQVKDEDLYLIPTAEFSLIGLYTDKAMPEDKMPLKLCGYSMSFRKELGSHSVDEKGLFRTHQFNKVEMIMITKPEDSYKYFDEMVKLSEEIYQQLEIPYRILEMCSGDLGPMKGKQVDLEAWFPRRNDYGEVGSCSNLTDNQARRLNIIGVDKQGNRRVLHTLNNTVLATSRAMVAILENFQQKDGSVKVPKALWPYMNGIKIIKKS